MTFIIGYAQTVSLKHNTTEYNEMSAYLQTQRVFDQGEIATMLRELKTSANE